MGVWGKGLFAKSPFPQQAAALKALLNHPQQLWRFAMQTSNSSDFARTAVIGAASLKLNENGVAQALEAGPYDLSAIGACKKVSVTCISEVGWWDTQALLGDLMRGGGPAEADQWTCAWDPANAAGSCSLVEVENLDGSSVKFLVDTGWNSTYMDARFKAEGVDRMLESGEIAFLYLTHEHLDHFWGLEAVLTHRPDIPILMPSTFHAPALSYLEGVEFEKPGIKNPIPHKGQVITLQVGAMTSLMDGVVSVGFDVPIILKVQGEQSLYFNVQDAGLVLFTGCCHQNIVTFADYAIANLNARDRLYGLYGGLHLAPFGSLGDKENGWIEKIASYGFKKIAANHCTGILAIQKMHELGYPVIRGTASNGSQSDLHLGNGDRVVFG
jgi:7,8-dihydropterin-6-yl-methyl-4-(beta-D-ribofuranosyl)aminobenzene 5'-phosphate synthase